MKRMYYTIFSWNSSSFVVSPLVELSLDWSLVTLTFFYIGKGQRKIEQEGKIWMKSFQVRIYSIHYLATFNLLAVYDFELLLQACGLLSGVVHLYSFVNLILIWFWISRCFLFLFCSFFHHHSSKSGIRKVDGYVCIQKLWFPWKCRDLRNSSRVASPIHLACYTNRPKSTNTCF